MTVTKTKDSLKNSYTAANALPLKLFHDDDLVKSIVEGYIPPVHVQLIPTNKCNLNCSFCSCKKRNKTEELTIGQIEEICDILYKSRCKAVTITGGGEPLMHAQISEIFQCLSDYNIKIGLVTNGFLLDKLNTWDFKHISWCRISCADERSFDILEPKIAHTVERNRNVDWAFSYVMSKFPDISNLTKYIQFANSRNFTHIRVVSDLLDLDNITGMDWIKEQVQCDDSLVVYQGRKEFDRGSDKCWISLLKPVIGADGYIYPCCGVQYAHEQEDLDNPESMRMGHIGELSDVISSQRKFCGSGCYRCYYDNYNKILDVMLSDIEHKEFV